MGVKTTARFGDTTIPFLHIRTQQTNVKLVATFNAPFEQFVVLVLERILGTSDGYSGAESCIHSDSGLQSELTLQFTTGIK